MMQLFEHDSSIETPTTSNEWYTPAKYVDAAREVFGGNIDLDPASCEMANQTVKATRYYSIEDNGLAQDWAGNTWLNPPYGLDKSKPNDQRSTIRMWINVLLRAYQSNNVPQAIALVTTQMNARWFLPLWQFPICFPDGNIRFHIVEPTQYRPGRMTDSHTYGNCFVYLGPNEARFIEVFSQFGRIAKAIDVPKPKLTTLNLWESEEVS